MRADVAVIGGGIAGASAAWHLAAAGADVVLLEQEASPGHHATGRSAAVLSETSGDDTVCALAARSRPFLEQPPDGFVDHPLLSPRGLLWVGRIGDEAALDAVAEIGRRHRPASVRRLDGAGTAHIVPALVEQARSAGGVHEPEAMSIDVDALLWAFLRGIGEVSRRVYTSLELLQAVRSGASWRIHAGDREIRCTSIVDAAGAWGDLVAARCGVPPLGLQPVRRTAAVAVSALDVTRWPLVMDVAGRWYAEPAAGGLLISPADEHPSDACDARAEEIDVACALDTVSEAIGSRLRAIRRAWAGLRTFCPDRRPAIGPDPGEPSFVWLVGQGGGGIKTAPAAGAMAAAYALGSSPDPMNGDGLAQQLLPDRLR
jgi:D-arginine dehydrogenase